MAGVSASAVEEAVVSALRRSGMNSGSVTIDPADPTQAGAGEVVSVQVAVDYSEVGLMGLGRLMPLPESVSGRAAMVKEPGP